MCPHSSPTGGARRAGVMVGRGFYVRRLPCSINPFLSFQREGIAQGSGSFDGCHAPSKHGGQASALYPSTELRVTGLICKHFCYFIYFRPSAVANSSSAVIKPSAFFAILPSTFKKNKVGVALILYLSFSLCPSGLSISIATSTNC
jgi:hypothetical protein